ncbi:GntR family transcriptional regulator [Verrucomicrobium sp. GAS474]|uniref:GntR family transcriptional regulator n=1 Tax=Verrucomicrobium sp. GAS474 TaxID=1882831 RepID=UPI00087A187C|nr:GntR family transcriptional regulator [Verrucomicrobium sp. GAS474]SDT92216.1 GntR family transcriptional regulator [Verrucomicrobium sp. GAS474]
MSWPLNITTDSDLPIYRQVYNQVRRAVLTGARAEGETLPSVRALAEHLIVNPNTIARAYQELTRDGLIEARPGKGYYIARPKCLLSDAERQRRCAEAADLLLDEAVFLDFTPSQVDALLKKAWKRFEKP